MGRPAKKRCYAEAKATRKGQLQAELEAHKKKPLEESIKEHIGKAIDRIDWIETGAIGIGTILIHGLVASDKHLVTHIMQTFGSATLGFGAWGITSWLTEEAIMRIIPQIQKTEPQIPDWQLWAASFFCAYVICKYGGQLVGLLDKGLGNVVPMLLGATA